jgi:hypothetical protein
LQDIWISYPKGATERSIGTSVRYYDVKSTEWRVVWIAPTADTIIKLTGGPLGDRIVLGGQDTDGSSLRWSFNEIRPDSFVWRGESSRDGGKTWWLQEEHHLKRRSGGSASRPTRCSARSLGQRPLAMAAKGHDASVPHPL